MERPMTDHVWIEAVPLPFIGWRYDTCGACGAKFRGRDRRGQYEAHYREAHLPGDGLVMVIAGVCGAQLVEGGDRCSLMAGHDGFHVPLSILWQEAGYVDGPWFVSGGSSE